MIEKMPVPVGGISESRIDAVGTNLEGLADSIERVFQNFGSRALEARGDGGRESTNLAGGPGNQHRGESGNNGGWLAKHLE